MKSSLLTDAVRGLVFGLALVSVVYYCYGINKDARECNASLENVRGNFDSLNREFDRLQNEAATLRSTLATAVNGHTDVYEKLASATVRIDVGGALCHGVIGEHSGKIIIHTAAHCVVRGGKKTGGRFWVARKLTAANDYKGWGFDVGATPDGAFGRENITQSPRRDMAFIIGVGSLQSERARKLALKLADAPPPPLQVVYTTHWQPVDWKIGSQEAQGEFLFPSLGVAEGQDREPNLYMYALPVYPGDSGSGIVNSAGQIVGIISRRGTDTLKTFAVGPRTISGFLDEVHRKFR